MTPALSTREVLVEARRLIEDPSNWSQRKFACTETGRSCGIVSPRAVAWCAEGACVLAARRAQYGELYLIDKLSEAIGNGSVSLFNDSSSHADVLAAFDRAIEAAS
jgi:hypothetical protein